MVYIVPACVSRLKYNFSTFASDTIPLLKSFPIRVPAPSSGPRLGSGFRFTGSVSPEKPDNPFRNRIELQGCILCKMLWWPLGKNKNTDLGEKIEKAKREMEKMEKIALTM